MAKAHDTKINYITLFHISIWSLLITFYWPNWHFKVNFKVKVAVNEKNSIPRHLKVSSNHGLSPKPRISWTLSSLGLSPLDLKTKELKTKTKTSDMFLSYLILNGGTKIGPPLLCKWKNGTKLPLIQCVWNSTRKPVLRNIPWPQFCSLGIYLMFVVLHHSWVSPLEGLSHSNIFFGHFL